MGRKLGKMKLPPGFPFGELGGSGAAAARARRQFDFLLGVQMTMIRLGAFRRPKEPFLPHLVSGRAAVTAAPGSGGHYTRGQTGKVLLKYDASRTGQDRGCLSDTVKRLVESPPVARADGLGRLIASGARLPGLPV